MFDIKGLVADAVAGQINPELLTVLDQYQALCERGIDPRDIGQVMAAMQEGSEGRPIPTNATALARNAYRSLGGLVPDYSRDPIRAGLKALIYEAGNEPRFIALEDLLVPGTSPAVHYARALFEGGRGVPIRDKAGDLVSIYVLGLRERFERMKRGAEISHLDFDFNLDDLCKRTCDLIKENGMHAKLEDGKFAYVYIRPLLYQNNSPVLGVPKKSGPVNLAVIVEPWESYVHSGTSFKALMLPMEVALGDKFSPAKLTVRYPWSAHVKFLLANHNATYGTDFNEVLGLNPDGSFAEFSAANVVFITKNSELYTPDKGCLPGETVKVVKAIGEELGFTFYRQTIRPEHLDKLGVIAALATGTASGLVQVSQIGDYEMNSELASKIVAAFQRKYHELENGLNPAFLDQISMIARPTQAGLESLEAE